MLCRCVVVGLCVASFLFGSLPGPALALDYLEHSFLTDRGCLEAQRRLAPYVADGGAALQARYFALALACPAPWDRPYCKGGYKQVGPGLNHLRPEMPAEEGDLAVTLGDFSALADHQSDFGPIRGLAHSAGPGLISSMWRWLAAPPHDVGGVIADVAEDGCESNEEVDWTGVEHSLTSWLREHEARAGYAPLPAAFLSPLNRAPPNRGPYDRPGPYSFDNPHYLDLVRRNWSHFGVDAEATWLGMRTAGLEVAARSCEQVLGLDADDLTDIAEDMRGEPPLSHFAAVAWDDLGEATLRAQGCAMLRELVRVRLAEWRGRAEASLVAPVDALLGSLVKGGESPLVVDVLDRTVSSLMAAVFVGVGLHFMQDNFSGGHLRTVPSAHDLEVTRTAHDADGHEGVRASLETRLGTTEFVAFGDSYLLGPLLEPDAVCRPAPDVARGATAGASPSASTSCLVQEQRGLLFASLSAALVDWALGGPLSEPTGDAALATERAAWPAGGCPAEDSPVRFACRYLPTRANVASGMPRPTSSGLLAAGTLPTPLAPFSYESLLFATGIDAAGRGLQVGARAVFLSQLGPRADWMTSYHFGLMSVIRGAHNPDLLTEFSYMFHWRWAARFLVNAGAFVHGGVRGLGGSVTSYAGVGPGLGVSALPEGWMKIPLEIMLSYRMPITLVDSRYRLESRAIHIEAHWLELAVGLAFM